MIDVKTIGPGQHATADLFRIDTTGPDGVIWGVASPQLNTNLVKLDPGSTIEPHTNTEVDVLVVVQAGDGVVTIDGTVIEVIGGSVALIPVNAERSISAVSELVYLSIHTRRQGLRIKQTN